MINVAERNKTIDIFRALTVFLMCFVNITWMVDGVPHWIEHAETMEDFLGLADYVFPGFLFAIGLSIPYAIENRLAKTSGLDTVFHILKRSLALIIMGVFCYNIESGVADGFQMHSSYYELLMVLGFLLVWNAYPKVDGKKKHIITILKWVGVALLIYLAIIYRGPVREGRSSVTVFRSGWWGILGILGWTYLVAAFLYLALRSNVKKFAIAFGILFALCMFLSNSHLEIIRDEFNYPFNKSFVYSLLSVLSIPPGSHLTLCVGGILTTLVASGVKEWKPAGKAALASGVALILLLSGVLLHNFWIFSKNLATPSTVCINLSVSVAVYSLIQFLVTKKWDKPFCIIASAGTSTLTCYFMQTILGNVIYLLEVPTDSLTGILAILYCIVFAFACVGATAILEKVGIRLKM